MPVLKQISKLTTGRALFQIAVIIVAMVILTPQFKDFLASPIQVNEVQIGWLVIALAFVIASLFPAAMVYVALLSPKLKLGRTTIVQLATSFTNRLLPAGIGGMGTYVRYLTKQKIPAADSAVAVGANQIIGIFSFLLLAAVLGFTTQPKQIHLSLSIRAFGYIGIAAVLAGMLLPLLGAMLPKMGKKLTHVIGQIWRSIIQLASQPKKTCLALAATLGITIFYSLCLYASMRAVGVSLGWRPILIIYLASSLANSVAPTPGGLGAVEAALVAGFRAVSVPPTESLSGVLVYRTISFWLPILPGYVAFRWLMRHKQL